MFTDLVFGKLTFFEQGLHASGFQVSPTHEQKDRRGQGQGAPVLEGTELQGAGCAGGVRAQACQMCSGGTLDSAEGAPGWVLGDQGDTGSLHVWGATRRLR